MQTNKSQEIFSLSISKRIQLAEDIWDISIAADQNAVEITDMQKNELDKRLADYTLNPDDGDTWNHLQLFWRYRTVKNAPVINRNGSFISLIANMNVRHMMSTVVSDRERKELPLRQLL